MKFISKIALASLIMLTAISSHAATPDSAPKVSGVSAQVRTLNTNDLNQIFTGYNAAFVLNDQEGKSIVQFSPKNCSERMSPCSTFKIMNSLIGLETGAVKDLDSQFKWDGTHYSRDEWNKDQTLQSAITNSVVWCFQQLATKIGTDNMKTYLARVGYGNEDMSAGLTKFWLGSSLKISPDEQAQLMMKLAEERLPFSDRTQELVQKAIRLKETDKGVLFGKTGTDGANNKMIMGWFVGFVRSGDKVYSFATNIRAADGAWGRKARSLTEKVLTQSGVL